MKSKPLFFKTQNEFRKWLEKNHLSETELYVGYYKVNSGKPSMTWPESVDQALCFGWIDGIKHSIDEESYQIRFTPRKKSSIWSNVNIKKVEKLIEEGLMHQTGLDSFNNRTPEKSGIYSFEKNDVALSHEYEKVFKQNHKAWTYFNALAPSYKKSCTHWVMSAKQSSTQLKRLTELIKESERGINRFK